jgi:hypothetical protein
VQARANPVGAHVLLDAEVVDDVGAHGGEHGMCQVAGVGGRMRGVQPLGELGDPELARGVRVVGVGAAGRGGVPRPFGVNVTAIDGHLYVCSATRDRDWVRNLLAAGRCRVERDGIDGEHTEHAPTMVEGHEAARALATYLPHLDYRDPQLPFEPDAPLDEIERHVGKAAVFRLDPTVLSHPTLA